VGPLYRFFAEDHRRLEGLLDRATAGSGPIDPQLFEEFRSGLLRHIGMEEKILLPAAQRALGGTPLPIAGRLRLDHGAIAALLVPTPTRARVSQLRALLAVHDALEEDPDGGYESCERLLTAEVDSLLEQLRNFPAVRTAPHNDGPLVERHIEDALARAGRLEITGRST
jgi:hypothetical protein